jgi:hypothetical protein
MNSSKRMSRGMDFSTPTPVPVASIGGSEIKTATSILSKWVPLICAGAAVGVSVMALKEIKNVRKELIMLKKEGNSSKSGKDELATKMELMDEQLRKITAYLANQNKSNSKTNSKTKSTIIKEAVKNKLDNVKIINSEDAENEGSDEEEVEVEVTDDEEES